MGQFIEKEIDYVGIAKITTYLPKSDLVGVYNWPQSLDYNGVGALRGQRHTPAKINPSTPPGQLLRLLLISAGIIILTMRQKMQRLSYGDDDVDTTTVNITERNITQITERHTDVHQPIKKYYSNFFLHHLFCLYVGQNNYIFERCILL